MPTLSVAGASLASSCPVSTLRSSNRTCGTTASGFRTRTHAFAHGKLCIHSRNQMNPAPHTGVRKGIVSSPSPHFVFAHNHPRSRSAPCVLRSNTSAHVGYRSEYPKIPSLWRAAPPAASEPLLEFVGSSPISRLSPLRTLTLNQGPFPPSALPEIPGTTGLSATPTDPACPSRESG